MSEELIAGNGKIFKRDGSGNFKEKGGEGITLTGRQMKEYESYSGVKTERLTDVAKTHPKFAQMMHDKSKK